jgi:hypothetical protein
MEGNVKATLVLSAVFALALASSVEAAVAVGDPAPDFGGAWINRPATTLA